MKKKMFILAMIACTSFSAYTISRSSSQPVATDICLQDVEALAQTESGDDSCKESLTKIWREDFGDGSYRYVGEYECGAGASGSCNSGYCYIYYNQSGEIIGTDDQRSLLHCA